TTGSASFSTTAESRTIIRHHGSEPAVPAWWRRADLADCGRLRYLRIATDPRLLDAHAPPNVSADNIDRFVSQPHVRQSARSRGSDPFGGCRESPRAGWEMRGQCRRRLKADPVSTGGF